jgi:hypothetical protein
MLIVYDNIIRAKNKCIDTFSKALSHVFSDPLKGQSWSVAFCPLVHLHANNSRSKTHFHGTRH